MMASWQLLQQQDLWFWILAVTGVYLTAIAKSGFAGGTGVIAVPLMALSIDPKVAASLLLPILIFIDLVNVRHYRGQQNSPLLKKLLPGSIAGIVFGMAVFHLLNAEVIKLIIGLIGLSFAINNFSGITTNQASESHPSALLSCLIGVISGFTSFVAHAGGPPLNGYLLKLQLNKTQLLATAAIFLAVTNVIKLPAYALVGQLTFEIGLFVVVMIPVAYLGIKTGYWVKNKINDNAYYRVMNSLLLIISSILLVGSVIPILLRK